MQKAIFLIALKNFKEFNTKKQLTKLKIKKLQALLKTKKQLTLPENMKQLTKLKIKKQPALVKQKNKKILFCLT
jgi:hypothetical protein